MMVNVNFNYFDWVMASISQSVNVYLKGLGPAPRTIPDSIHKLIPIGEGLVNWAVGTKRDPFLYGQNSLLGGAITILKNDGVKVNWKDDIPYMKWKIIQMFETTNQLVKMSIH